MSDMTIIPGCEPMSHAGTRDAGVLVLHGFTGNPSSMRLQADAFAELGYHVVPPGSSAHLAATAGGEVEHVWLDKSFHVATQDYDRDTITAGAAAFIARATAA